MRSIQTLPVVLAAYLASNAQGFAPIPTTSTKAATASTRLYDSPPKRQPWDVLRFVQQSSKFVSLPFAPKSKTTETIQSGQTIWRPSKNPDIFQWAPLDDVVMGGASSSTVDNVTGEWRGTVTDANSGGFVGIRSTPPSVQLDLTQCKGLEWTFQTSSKMPRRLKVVLRDSPDFNGIAWTTSVNLPTGNGKPRQVKVKVPLNKQSFVPTIFASIVEDAKEKGIDKSSITALQLVYSKFEFEGELNPQFQVGDFDLQLLEVKAY